MNEFKKEELEEIYRCLNYMIKGGITPYSCVTFDVKKKIKNMIDNYCEHENTCAHDWVVGFGSIHSPVTHCKKCSYQKPILPKQLFNKVMGINNEI